MWTFGFNVAKNKKMTLPSGNEIIIDAVGKIHYRLEVFINEQAVYAVDFSVYEPE